MLALIYIMKHIEDNNLPIKIVMTVHDQIDTICPIDLAEEWKEQMSELIVDSLRRRMRAVFSLYEDATQ